MRPTVTMIAALTAAMLSAAPGGARRPPPPEPVYGPPPDWARYRELGEAAIKARLVDPESARISWPNGYMKGGYKPFLAPRVYGYGTCGLVNSRNRMGGYVGDTPFVVVIDYDRVVYSEIDSANGRGLLAEGCTAMPLPPVSEMPNASTTGGAGGSGLSLTAVPDGAYVAAVEPGTVAARAGLTPGMVISHVNGVAIRGLALDMVRELIARSEGKARLTVIGGRMVEVEQPAPGTAASAGATAGATVGATAAVSQPVALPSAMPGN